jgi:predicted O-methyltransferase YrrM
VGLGLRKKISNLSSEIKYFFKNYFFRPNLYSLKSAERMGVIFNEPSDMCITDRIMLYSLVRGLRPEKALEIGARWGGSARIIVNAMQENAIGQLVGLDPETSAFRAKPKHLHGRYTLVNGYSPQDTPRAIQHLGSQIDFVFIDAVHIYDCVLADFKGVIPYLNPGAHVLFHDAFHQGVNAAIDCILAENPKFVDCGFMSRNPELGTPVAYQGLRLVRYGTVKSEEMISHAYTSRSLEPPRFSKKFWNYDLFAMRVGLAPQISEKDLES